MVQVQRVAIAENPVENARIFVIAAWKGEGFGMALADFWGMEMALAAKNERVTIVLERGRGLSYKEMREPMDRGALRKGCFLCK